jgi:hypothetical protein
MGTRYSVSIIVPSQVCFSVLTLRIMGTSVPVLLYAFIFFSYK